MILNKKSVTYVTDLKISVLKSIDYCKCYYYKDAIELMNIRISGARSRMDMLPDYFEAAVTSKICLSGTRGSA